MTVPIIVHDYISPSRIPIYWALHRQEKRGTYPGFSRTSQFLSYGRSPEQTNGLIVAIQLYVTLLA